MSRHIEPSLGTPLLYWLMVFLLLVPVAIGWAVEKAAEWGRR